MVALCNLPIERKLVLAFALLVLIAIIAGKLIANRLRFLEQSYGSTPHTHEVLDAAQEITAAMAELETGKAGIAALREWTANGPDLSVSVDLSTANLEDPGVPVWLHQFRLRVRPRSFRFLTELSQHQSD